MRFFITAILTAMLFSIITALPASSASGHGCAPPVPPGIPGSSGPAPATPGIVVINEGLLVPHSTWNCSETGAYSSATDTWIELYNTQNLPFDLDSAHAVIDSGPNTHPYYLPFGAAIAAQGYLVLFPRTSESFLATETSTLRVVIAGVTIDQVTFPQLGPDQSYARTSDGASTWQITSTPTIDASNSSSVSISSSPTPFPTSSSSSQGGHVGRGTISTSRDNNKTVVSGVQPQWNGLQLPSTTSLTPTASGTSTTLASSPLSSNDGLDIPRRIALTLLAIALALTLFWCWRLFAPR